MQPVEEMLNTENIKCLSTVDAFKKLLSVVSNLMQHRQDNWLLDVYRYLEVVLIFSKGFEVESEIFS